MDEIFLSLVFHDHQPVGNFGWVFTEAYHTAYLPMLECLERHPTIKATLHFTGPLRDWLIENEQDFLSRVKNLVAMGQIEILGGGYYEPILVALNEADRLGQLEKMSDAVEEDFGIRPRGAWLAERVWEPQLPATLARAGLEYVILDDTHFKAAGLYDGDLFGYYQTEDQGFPLKVFPTLKHLRYTIPWQPIDRVISWLMTQAATLAHHSRTPGKAGLALVGDDGEKFGMWPGTYDLVWRKQWMDDFFTELETNASWLKTITPGLFTDENPALGRIYLPTNSYDEMGEWSMPADASYELPALKKALKSEGREDIAGYMRGGLWRNFMVKYDEVNQLHKKAQRVSEKVHAMPDGEEKKRALDYLWAGQCNCGYWHGSFGGIYLFHIREINYRNLLTAESLANAAAGLEETAVLMTDFDMDGQDELIIETPTQNLFFDLDSGGALVEWDYLPGLINLTNVVTRRQEAYHRILQEGVQKNRVFTPEEAGQLDEAERENAVIVSEHGLEKGLVFDWHRRAMAIDHFLRAGTSLDEFASAAYGEQGDFINQPYKASIVGDEAILYRDGTVWVGEAQVSTKVEKTFQITEKGHGLMLKGRILNRSEQDLTATYGLEMSWGFAGGQIPEGMTLAVDGDEAPFAERYQHEAARQLIFDSQLWQVRLTMSLSQPADVWIFPLETISNSGSAYERTYQGTTMLLIWPLWLAQAERWQYSIEFSLNTRL